MLRSLHASKSVLQDAMHDALNAGLQILGTHGRPCAARRQRKLWQAATDMEDARPCEHVWNAAPSWTIGSSKGSSTHGPTPKPLSSSICSHLTTSPIGEWMTGHDGSRELRDVTQRPHTCPTSYRLCPHDAGQVGGFCAPARPTGKGRRYARSSSGHPPGDGTLRAAIQTQAPVLWPNYVQYMHMRVIPRRCSEAHKCLGMAASQPGLWLGGGKERGAGKSRCSKPRGPSGSSPCSVSSKLVDLIAPPLLLV